MRLYYLALLIVLFILGSCSTGNGVRGPFVVGYGPADEIGGIPTGGYADSKINGNTAIVNVQGNQYTCQGLVRTYLLYRCAQVTIANGYDYFVLVSSSLSGKNVNLHEVNVLQRVDNPRLFDTYYATTTFSGLDYSSRRAPIARGCGASAVIKMFNGRIPPGVPNAFDAENVIGNMGPATM